MSRRRAMTMRMTKRELPVAFAGILLLVIRLGLVYMRLQVRSKRAERGFREALGRGGGHAGPAGAPARVPAVGPRQGVACVPRERAVKRSLGVPVVPPAQLRPADGVP